jgi:hypothetical protein
VGCDRLGYFYRNRGADTKDGEWTTILGFQKEKQRRYHKIRLDVRDGSL